MRKGTTYSMTKFIFFDNWINKDLKRVKGLLTCRNFIRPRQKPCTKQACYWLAEVKQTLLANNRVCLLSTNQYQVQGFYVSKGLIAHASWHAKIFNYNSQPNLAENFPKFVKKIPGHQRSRLGKSLHWLCPRGMGRLSAHFIKTQLRLSKYP